MHIKPFFITSLTAFASLLGLSTSSPPPVPDQQEVVDFNTLLDGSLGYMPALWLAAHGALFEANINNGAISPDSPATAELYNLVNRTGKEEGSAFGAFMTAMLVPNLFAIKDDGYAKGLCKSLVAGVSGMTGSVVGQEGDKAIYGSNTTDFHQGFVPTVFLGGFTGSIMNSALSRTLCDKLVPNLVEHLADNAAQLAKVNRALMRGTPDILFEHLRSLGVEPARAAEFTARLGDTFRMIDDTSLDTALDHFTRELTSQTAQLSEAIVKDAGALSKPALGTMAKLSLITGSVAGLPSTPGAMPPILQAAPAVGYLQTLVGQLSSAVGLQQSIPGTAASASKLQPAVDGLRNGISQAASEMRNVGGVVESALTDVAKSALDGGAQWAHDGVKALQSLFPLPHFGSGVHRSSGSGAEPGDECTDRVTSTHTETHTTTVTETASTTLTTQVTEAASTTATMTLEHTTTEILIGTATTTVLSISTVTTQAEVKPTDIIELNKGTTILPCGTVVRGRGYYMNGLTCPLVDWCGKPPGVICVPVSCATPLELSGGAILKNAE